jgi:two-component system sensor histidine kinase KdpD
MSAMAVQHPATLATVAHELRGPLSVLQTTSELLERDFDLLDLQQIRVMVSAMHRRTLWLRDLVENLLCAATVGDGQLRLHLRPLDLRELFDEVEVLVEPILARKQQRIRVRARTALPIVAADARRVSQVLLNLITNASKYSGTQTMIELGAVMFGGRVRVTVADRGPGVSAKAALRIFEPYERAGRTDGDGLGIGLSVVRTIVEAHGGDVGVKKRRSGGAIFWFELSPIGGPVRSETSEPTESTNTHGAAELAKVEGGYVG